VILLDSAKLRQLKAGPSREGLKRGFAIIEREGTTRYFIVADSRQFSQWVQAITESIHEYSVDGAERGMGCDADIQMDELVDAGNLLDIQDADPTEGLDEDEKSELGSRLGARLAGARSRIGAVLESAKQKGKEKIDVRHDRQIDSLLGGDVISAGQGSPESMRFTTGEMDDVTGPKRRISFGGTLSGVKEATKNKLGTAIQNARQMGSESRNGRSSHGSPRAFIGVRNKLKGISPGPQSAEVGNRGTLSGGYVHRDDGQPSEMFDSTPALENALIQEAPRIHRMIESNDCFEIGAQNEALKRGRFRAIGSAVRNATQNRLTRRRGMESSNGSFHDDTPVTLKGVLAGRVGPSVGTTNEEKLRLKTLEGNWYVSVVAKSVKKGMSSSNPLKPAGDTNVVESAPMRDGLTSGSVPLNEGLLSPTQLSDGEETKQKWDLATPTFIVRSQRLDGITGTTTERLCGYGALLLLHSKISDSVGRMLVSGYCVPRAATGSDSPATGSDRSYIDLSTLDLVDNVLITGRALGGVLENEISEHSIERAGEYHGESRGARGN
jgi:hypothetical protein